MLFAPSYSCAGPHRAVGSASATQQPEVPGSIPGPATYFVSPSADSRRQLSVTGESRCTEYWLTA